ncbi:YciI family protein [Achromobacter aloeverae]|uniref:YciI family protein n=1 Tax=Achromobacter aloeverae TaxID=1750518 RepID=A0A4Q1HP96_9BURK|nr:YciI family protein [Achromobacter aloeverae]RXN92872.1 YciI family protein [Achromobacter aloeverae]
MTYFIETFDKPGHQGTRQALRPAHLAFLESNARRLLACGAKLHEDGSDVGGGIYVITAATREEARDFIEADPFFQGDLFAEIRITRWRKAYVDGVCHLQEAA